MLSQAGFDLSVSSSKAGSGWFQRESGLPPGSQPEQPRGGLAWPLLELNVSISGRCTSRGAATRTTAPLPMNSPALTTLRLILVCASV